MRIPQIQMFPLRNSLCVLPRTVQLFASVQTQGAASSLLPRANTKTDTENHGLHGYHGFRSGNHTRLACWFWRPRRNSLLSTNSETLREQLDTNRREGGSRSPERDECGAGHRLGDKPSHPFQRRRSHNFPPKVPPTTFSPGESRSAGPLESANTPMDGHGNGPPDSNQNQQIESS